MLGIHAELQQIAVDDSSVGKFLVLVVAFKGEFNPEHVHLRMLVCWNFSFYRLIRRNYIFSEFYHLFIGIAWYIKYIESRWRLADKIQSNICFGIEICCHKIQRLVLRLFLWRILDMRCLPRRIRILRRLGELHISVRYRDLQILCLVGIRPGSVSPRKSSG